MARRERYIVGLDVGTSTVVCVVCEGMDDNSLHVVGIGVAESKGIRRGAVVNLGFSPSDDELAWARRVLDAAEKSGGAAVAVDGKMVDRPVLLRARALLQAAKT